MLGRVEDDTTLAGTAADPIVIAEGVETTDQNQLLALAGCGFIALPAPWKIIGGLWTISQNDADGDIVAFSGTVDNAGTMLKLNDIVNGSPRGSCEIDDGTETMAKL